MTKKKVKKTPLIQHQVDDLAKKHFSSERLTVVRDIFLFCCYTGLPYAENKKLKRSDIFIGIDGYRWIDNDINENYFEVVVPCQYRYDGWSVCSDCRPQGER
jgi:hypothetical protein